MGKANTHTILYNTLNLSNMVVVMHVVSTHVCVFTNVLALTS